MIENTAIISEQGHRLQHIKTYSNTTAVSTGKKRKENAYLQKASGTQGSPTECPYLHCQPINEVLEGVHPSSTPSGHSGVLHSPELPCIGLDFPSGASSLVQAMT